MPADGALKFLTDQNVPEDVVRCLVDRGHVASRVRDEMAANSTDPIVAMAAINAGRILVSWDRDFGHQRFMKPRIFALEPDRFLLPGACRLQALGNCV